MELKIGDKVRYLDAVGGGIVKSFKGKDQVLVLEEDGFETPVLKRQCVVIESKPEASRTEVSVKPVVKVTESRTSKGKTYLLPQNPDGERLNLSLAFLPSEGYSFQESVFESYLINESNFHLSYIYASCNGASWTCRASGVIEPNSKIFLEEFGRDVIQDLEKLSVQLLAFKEDRAYSYKQPLSVEIRLDTVKFYKIHCFRSNDFFDEDALVVPVVRNDVPERSLMTDADVIREAMLAKKVEKTSASVPLKPQKSLLEVDLHASSLLDTTSGMDAAAILEYQLGVFRSTMEANKGKKGTKIVFIHGKGEGVLRAALLKELKNKYGSCRAQDASFREYGFGATQVTIA
jgi:hypothetical protein